MTELAPDPSTTIRAGRKPRNSTAGTQPARPKERPSFASPLEPSDPKVAAAARQKPNGLSDDVASLFGNLSGASVMAAGLVAAGAARAFDRSTFDPDPMHLRPVLLEAACRTWMNPTAALGAQATMLRTGLEAWHAGWRALLGGKPEPSRLASDRRFSDPAWDQPLFDLSRRLYALASDCAEDLANAAELSDPLDKRRLAFFTKAALDALAPSNFLHSNPAALREAFETRGESLLRGLRNLSDDLQRGAGRLSISQTDMQQFEVGRNVAISPGKVVFRNDLFELLQFSPTTPQVFETPVLLITPWINKYYIVDLRPENSLIRWLTEQGHTVFLTSWVNPDHRYADKSFEDYMRDGVLTAVAKTLEQADAAEVNAVGYCIGGTILASTMAYLEAVGAKSPIRSATFFAAQQDFSEAGDLLLFSQEAWLKDVERQMDATGGVLPGHAMADAFNQLRANDLIWSFVISNYLLGRSPKAFDLLFWNADATRMPKRLHLWYLREFYQQNKFAAGELMLDGVKVDLRKVTTPVFVQASKEDHIAPFASVYRGARLFGGPTTFVLAGSGHIAGVINHPAAQKYQHWVNPILPETADHWLASAEERPGSWWPLWGAWLAERSGKLTAARDPSGGPLPALADAPGEYVLVRS